MPEHPSYALPALPAGIKLTNEFRLLVACSWIAPQNLEHDQAAGISSLCDAGVDWNEFLFLVKRHRIPAQAYAAVTRHAADRCPPRVHQILKEWNLLTCACALKHEAELIRLNRLFAARGIGMIPLKGIALSLQLYGTTRMRHSSDLDLLVQAGDIDAVDALLRADGYRLEHLGEKLTARQKEYLKANIHHYQYANDSGIHLELHCRSSFHTPEESANLWRLPKTVKCAGDEFTVLNDDNLLPYLCEHGARHKWFRLKWLSDVAMLLAHDRITEWDGLLSAAKKQDAQRIMAHSALLVQWLYGLALPQAVCELITREKAAVGLSVDAVHALLTERGVESEIIGTPFTGLRRLRHMARLRPALSFRAVWQEVLIGYLDFEAFPLPNRLFWLYLPLRPVFWLWRTHVKPRRPTRTPPSTKSILEES